HRENVGLSNFVQQFDPHKKLIFPKYTVPVQFSIQTPSPLALKYAIEHHSWSLYEDYPRSVAFITHYVAGAKPLRRYLDYRYKHEPAFTESDTVFACQWQVARP